MGTVHVIGAGMAGLSCAVQCAKAGHSVAIYEASPQAGGRCRSFQDEGLGCLIDNGSHMLIGANEATKNYLDDIGSRDLVSEIVPATFPFFQPDTGQQWQIKPGSPYFPMWLLAPGRRVPGTNPIDYAKALRLSRAKKEDTVRQIIGGDDPLYDRLWQPICRAVLNTDADDASAQLLWKVLKLSFLKGESACRPMIFEKGLSAALVNPALAFLENSEANIRYQARLRGIRWENDVVLAMRFPEGLLRVENEDTVVLAVPPDISAELWPDTNPPQETLPIVNVHFRVREPVELPGGLPFLGLIGTDSQWIFSRDNVLSITISAASAHVDMPNWEIANQLWSEVTAILGRNMGRLPPWRVIKERRATIAQTPTVLASRPGAKTALNNLFIAGDWTNTGLPATIEGAIQSGRRAARLAIRRMTKVPEDN
ncbi:MAG: FAD-dependent oxidoreductase [Alphaproteobacteria bacterium]|nr:FAD-dependent oxidoreductase [Alphaproteobacteria bacterium]